MADLLQQATIGDDPTFQRKVRAAIVTRALAASTSTELKVRQLAQAVLEKPDEWAVQIARGLASKTSGYPAITRADQIDDAAIATYLNDVFVAYLAAS